ncbi:hypothetical protein IF1G_00214 [Cordyceps javanica]|uniref:Uncharacterized protein n=1 Tax=Cordyceps javanica TaxID=43265 RepID=A0A545VEY1_9HYPO|nr:hypothetical protein IF1G_00214 [Cordyceps javanica]
MGTPAGPWIVKLRWTIHSSLSSHLKQTTRRDGHTRHVRYREPTWGLRNKLTIATDKNSVASRASKYSPIPKRSRRSYTFDWLRGDIAATYPQKAELQRQEIGVFDLAKLLIKAPDYPHAVAKHGNTYGFHWRRGHKCCVAYAAGGRASLTREELLETGSPKGGRRDKLPTSRRQGKLPSHKRTASPDEQMARIPPGQPGFSLPLPVWHVANTAHAFVAIDTVPDKSTNRPIIVAKAETAGRNPRWSLAASASNLHIMTIATISTTLWLESETLPVFRHFVHLGYITAPLAAHCFETKTIVPLPSALVSPTSH